MADGDGGSDGGGFGGSSDSGGFGSSSDGGGFDSSSDSGFGSSSDGGGFDSSSDSGFGSSSDLGSSDLGSSDLGSSDLGSSDLGSTDTSFDAPTTLGSPSTSFSDPSTFDSPRSGFSDPSTFGSPSSGFSDPSTFGSPSSSFGDPGLSFGDSSAGLSDVTAAPPATPNYAAPSSASSDGLGFTVSTSGLGDVNSTMGSLVQDGQGVLSGMSSMNLDPTAFGMFGSPVADAAQSLTGNQLSALGRTFDVLGSVNDGIGFSNANYQDADQQISAGLGGLTDPSASTSPYGSLTDPAASTTSGLPTFATLPSDQAAAIDTLNAQDTQTPASLADDPAMQAQLAQHEASRNHVYTDTMGHPSVGIGFNLDRSGAADALSAVGADYNAVRAGTQDLTDAQITQLAHADTQHAVDVARSYYSGFDQLDPARQRALVDMTFDLNGKINQFTGLHQALVNGDYNAAADHIANSAFARQTHSRGVDLANQMRNGGQ